MHIFFTQFLDDTIAHERSLGIECGLDWTDHSDEIWFCLRPGETASLGMRRAIERDQELVRAGKVRALKFLLFTQEGEPAGTWEHSGL